MIFTVMQQCMLGIEPHMTHFRRAVTKADVLSIYKTLNICLHIIVDMLFLCSIAVFFSIIGNKPGKKGKKFN